jgi:radical SAM superfamily enzyme YgiQ (UPF0313 family)
MSWRRPRLRLSLKADPSATRRDGRSPVASTDVRICAAVAVVIVVGEAMRVELVCPAAEDSAHLRSLAMATLAALTPDDVELSLRDDIVRKIDPIKDIDGNADLAAITASTKTAVRAYELAAAYRERGVPVVMGGIHPTAMPDEVLLRADAVVIGEAEGLWEQVIADVRAKRLRRIYKHDRLPDFRTPPWPKRSVFPARGYVPVQTVQASRGCPFACEFCSVAPFFGRKTRLRDPQHVAKEIASLGHRWVMFADDNIIGHGEHSRALFRALKPLKLTWFGQASLLGMQDPETVRLMAESGCRAVFVGFETVNRRSLVACGKRQNHPDQYVETVKRLHHHGIAVWAAFVFGFDEDGSDVFEATARFAEKAGVFMASFSVLTPYPGTPLFFRLKQEGRLLDEQWWLHNYRDGYPVFRPKQMSPDQLFEGWHTAWKEFYSASSIARRLPRASVTSWITFLSFLPINLFERRLTYEKIIGGKKFFVRDRRGD